MNCEIARKICIVQALSKSGHFPKKESEKKAWFLSPFRSETEASFKVDKIKNCWYDHGIGKGGNIIDLFCMLYSCSVKEALEILNKSQPIFSFHQQPVLEGDIERKKDVITILKIKDIIHPALIEYLHSRKISIKAAKRYCKEVWYKFKGKTYFAIGLKNQSGGWELRNKYFKNSTSPKNITHIQNRSNQLIITEGMFDLLSIVTYHQKLKYVNDNMETDFLILNSTAFFDKAIEIIPTYKHIELYLDNDNTGNRITQKFLEVTKNCIDKSSLYKEFKDINQWLVSKEELSV
ncbi:MAG: toprim domain-containing protein [Bacteroidota bacterium]